MINWTFDPNDYNPDAGNVLIPVGRYRVRIEDAEEKESKAGRDMIKLTLSVSGQSGKLWFYLVFMPDNKQITNQRLGEIWECFNLKVGDMNILNWKGKVGGCTVKHVQDEISGGMRAQLGYFLKRRQQEELPAWKEQGGNVSNQPMSLRDEIPEDGSGSWPFSI